jgi:glycosyltransferase involved in cell wall biosynthesis
MGENIGKVTCIMITANRLGLAERSIECFINQSYPNKELLIIDDGTDDLEPLLQRYIPDQYVYHRLEKKEGQNLGFLRNLGLDLATGEFIAQWDDDDWYHPDRLKLQVEALNQGADACILQATLMHLNTSSFMDHPYIGWLHGGVPGTIVHRNDALARYPLEARGEDTTFLDYWRSNNLTVLPVHYSYLFIRCFHGNNTWEELHFTRRIRNNLTDSLYYFWYKYMLRDLFGHRRFRLNDQENKSFRDYVDQSKRLRLF